MITLAFLTPAGEATASHDDRFAYVGSNGLLCSAPTEMEAEYRLMVIDEVSLPDSIDRLSPSMPYVADTSEIYFVVSDSALCSRAAKALAVYQGRDAANLTPVYVLRVGWGHFIVFNYRKEGEFIEYSLFDSAFNHLDDWLH